MDLNCCKVCWLALLMPRRSSWGPSDYYHFCAPHFCILCRSVLSGYVHLSGLGTWKASRTGSWLWSRNSFTLPESQTSSLRKSTSRARPVSHCRLEGSSASTLAHGDSCAGRLVLSQLWSHRRADWSWQTCPALKVSTRYLHLAILCPCTHSRMDLRLPLVAMHSNFHQLEHQVLGFGNSLGLCDWYW